MEHIVISAVVLVVMLSIVGGVLYFTMMTTSGPPKIQAVAPPATMITSQPVQPVLTREPGPKIAEDELDAMDDSKWYDQELQYNFAKMPERKSWWEQRQDRWDAYNRRVTQYPNRWGVDAHGCAIHPDIKYCHALGRCEWKWNCPKWSKIWEN